MKTIIDEYGKLLISSIIGIVVVAAVVSGIRYWYISSYPQLQKDEGIIYQDVSNSPVLLLKPIEIEAVSPDSNQSQEGAEAHDFLQYVTAYENGDENKKLPVTIIGLDSVNLEKQGIYSIIYEVQSSTGELFSKKATVLVY